MLLHPICLAISVSFLLFSSFATTFFDTVSYYYIRESAACFASLSVNIFPRCLQLNEIFHSSSSSICITFVLIWSIRFVWLFLFFSEFKVIWLSVCTEAVLYVVCMDSTSINAIDIANCFSSLYLHF